MEIKLRADEARDMAALVDREAQDSQASINSLHGTLGGLSNSFTGRSADAFERAFTDWKNSADQMIHNLESLGTFLKQAVNTIEETDQRIASSLS